MIYIFYAIFLSLEDLSLYFLRFHIYNNIYSKYCHSNKKRYQPIKSETLSLKTIINESNFLRKTVIIQ